MKIITIVGARPQIIKAAAISRAIAARSEIQEIIVHTGQHYDDNMSEVFFRELGIPFPNINLKVGSGSHGDQTSIMIEKIEKVLISEKPDAIVVYGDTNSTLATAVAAAKIHVPIVHVEAGLRSFNKKMPEEVNRIMCDHVSTLLFSPTKTGLTNLVNEGFSLETNGKASMDQPKIYHCGDVMYDNSLQFSELSNVKPDLMNELKLEKDNFILSTVHRNDNTDNQENLQNIFHSFLEIGELYQLPIVLPLHPRTSKMMEKILSIELLTKIQESKHIRIIPPASFLDIISLEKNCRLVITDSGGVQKEAYFFKKPCIILRPQTEWVEIVETGSAVITDANHQKIMKAVAEFFSNKELDFPPVFGNGKAAEFIIDEIINQLK